jgi:hypothetical protein
MMCKLTSEVLGGKKLIAVFPSVLVIVALVGCVLAGEADVDSSEIDEAQMPFYPPQWDMGNGMNMMNPMFPMYPMFPMDPMMPMNPEMPPIRPQPVTPAPTTSTTTSEPKNEDYPIDYSETFSAMNAIVKTKLSSRSFVLVRLQLQHDLRPMDSLRLHVSATLHISWG